MKNIIINIGIAPLLAMVLSACTSNTTKDFSEKSFDGLSLVKNEKHTMEYLKGNADFTAYDKILILPSQVAFKKNWQRDYNNDHIRGGRIKSSDVEKIKKSVKELFDETFADEMKNVDGYSIVTENGLGVMVLRPAVIDLDVHAPDIQTASRFASFVETAGSGTLSLEFYDGMSNEILARVADSKKTRNRGYHSWANRVTNSADTKQLIRRWAKQLTEILEDIKEK